MTGVRRVLFRSSVQVPIGMQREPETQARRSLLQTWRSSLAPSRVYTREHFHPECEGSEEEERGGLPLPLLTRDPGAWESGEQREPVLTARLVCGARRCVRIHSEVGSPS